MIEGSSSARETPTPTHGVYGRLGRQAYGAPALLIFARRWGVCSLVRAEGLASLQSVPNTAPFNGNPVRLQFPTEHFDTADMHRILNASLQHAPATTGSRPGSSRISPRTTQAVRAHSRSSISPRTETPEPFP